MARNPPSRKQPANLSVDAIPDAINKLQRRLRDFEAASPEQYTGNLYDLARSLCFKLDSTLTDVFGHDSLEYDRIHVSPNQFTVSYLVLGGGEPPANERLAAFKEGQNAAISRIGTMIEFLSEQIEDSSDPKPTRALRAYEGLDLHPEIERATSQLYLDGHYANAIEDAVKALNNLVRLRSGEVLDGTKLMERVFSPNGPLLRFNDLQDQADIDEQRGFMMLFCGAVAGLRNPRAHKLIQDDSERALEFIAFVSLLAKLLDGAKKNT